uniref:Uncharacterized protein n=1 Tax=Arundo donax TaxID=35708 RepID=A0A0A9D4U0_ARUDO
MTTGRSLEAKTSAIEWSANAIPCLPSQCVPPNSTPGPRSRMYKETRVESVSCILSGFSSNAAARPSAAAARTL